MHILLADDQVDVREALKCLLQNECDVKLSNEAGTASELLIQLALGCPDMLLLDWELPGPGGRALMRAIRACCPSVRVIALSVRPEARSEALAAGVQGFVSKGDPPECVLAALRAVRAAH
jgi:DNA-binding NarL/FixJ family response regulator